MLLIHSPGRYVGIVLSGHVVTASQAGKAARPLNVAPTEHNRLAASLFNQYNSVRPGHQKAPCKCLILTCPVTDS